MIINRDFPGPSHFTLPLRWVCSDQDPWFIPVRINYPISLHLIEFIPDKAQFALKGYENTTHTALEAGHAKYLLSVYSHF